MTLKSARLGQYENPYRVVVPASKPEGVLAPQQQSSDTDFFVVTPHDAAAKRELPDRKPIRYGTAKTARRLFSPLASRMRDGTDERDARKQTGGNSHNPVLGGPISHNTGQCVTPASRWGILGDWLQACFAFVLVVPGLFSQMPRKGVGV